MTNMTLGMQAGHESQPLHQKASTKRETCCVVWEEEAGRNGWCRGFKANEPVYEATEHLDWNICQLHTASGDGISVSWEADDHTGVEDGESCVAREENADGREVWDPSHLFCSELVAFHLHAECLYVLNKSGLEHAPAGGESALPHRWGGKAVAAARSCTT